MKILDQYQGLGGFNDSFAMVFFAKYNGDVFNENTKILETHCEDDAIWFKW